MKTPILWSCLILSVAANVYQFGAQKTKVDVPVGKPSSSNASPGASPSPYPAPSPSSSGGGADLSRWPKPQSSADVRRLADEMRRAGYPRSVVRAVVTQAITDLFSDKDPLGKLPFWQRSGPDPETLQASRDFTAARAKEIENVLGRAEAALGAIDGPIREARYGSLSDEKILAILDLQKEYGELRSKHLNLRSNVWREDDPNLMKLKTLQEEERADIKALLTPEEYAEYDKRNGIGSLQIMQSSRGLKLSESEYTTLLRLQQDVVGKNPNYSFNGNPKQNADTDAMLGEARQILGDERFFLFLEGHQPAYGAVNRFVKERSAPLSNDQRFALFQVQRDLESLNYRRSSSNLGPADISSELAGINTRLESILGPQLATEYLSRGPGQSHVRMLGASGKP